MMNMRRATILACSVPLLLVSACQTSNPTARGAARGAAIGAAGGAAVGALANGVGVGEGAAIGAAAGAVIGAATADGRRYYSDRRGCYYYDGDRRRYVDRNRC
jgi:osmotically inducible lipoprotein OsmB